MLNTLKRLIFGAALNPNDQKVYHQVGLIAFFAWVGLGADGLSSASYGPEEAFLALGQHTYLSLFVAIATAITVLVISASYSQLIEVFPSGGGGYVVASKLLNPEMGMVCGCALLIDYLLTIAISVASGTLALFSFLPPEYGQFKLLVSCLGIAILIIMNLRGVKESVVPLVPIFLVFIITHFFVIIYALVTHVWEFPSIVNATHQDFIKTHAELGTWGVLFLILRAYSLGAGTYTGIEAVSNGLGLLKEPRVKTGQRTMLYMSVSLAFTVFGLMVAYLIYKVAPQHGKTLNAVLFQTIAADWGTGGNIFVWVSLISEAMILFVAAQAGFLGGPRVLASMALDRWFPARFAALSDRLVHQKGIWLMGLCAMFVMIATQGSVHLLVVLYSINVFITFCLSQLGMVKHWIKSRHVHPKWKRKLCINGAGFLLTTFILISVVILKFHEGGWATLVGTGLLICLAVIIKGHYRNAGLLLKRLDPLIDSMRLEMTQQALPKVTVPYDSKGKTAILIVNGFNGLGAHTLFNVTRFFGSAFKNYVFVQIGIIDAGNFKGVDEVDALKQSINKANQQYVDYMKAQGYFAESFASVGIDVVDEVSKIAGQLSDKYPGAVYFGGQLVFTHETFWTRWLHNYTVFALQRRLYSHGIPLVIMPIRVY